MTRHGTSALRQLWRPWEANSSRMVMIPMRGFKFFVADAAKDAFEAAHVVAQTHGYDISAPDCGSFAVRKITGGSGYSLHSYGIAEDWNWQTNPYRARSTVAGGRTITDMPTGMVSDVKSIRAKRTGEAVFRWGGEYNTVMDSMHWEIVVSPDDLRDGVDWTTVAGAEGRSPTPSSDPPSIITDARDNPLCQPTLRRGSKGPTVRRLQQELVDAGQQTSVDGIFGKDTERVVRAYQASRCLTVDGVVGRATWTLLLTDHPAVPRTQRPGRDVVTIDSKPPAPSPSTPTTPGWTTKVLAGEGWVQVSKRVFDDASRAGDIQALNGGPQRMLHPGDELQLPA